MTMFADRRRPFLLTIVGIVCFISLSTRQAGAISTRAKGDDKPTWIPPSPGWKIQPWESPPVGGGPPVESVNHYSKAFSTPFATSGQPTSNELRNAFPGVNSPFMPAPGLSGHDYGGAAGGTAYGANICAEQCLIGASVKANLAGKEQNRKALGEGCLEGCGVKNPNGAISTLLTKFVSGGTLANIRYNHNAWLGMLGTNHNLAGGGGNHYGSTFAHESCYEMTISGFKKDIVPKEAATQLLSCNNFGSISDLSLPHQACVMGVMHVLGKLDQMPDVPGCDNAACGIRTRLKTCDPLIFAGENPNVARQAADTARLARVHPGLYAGEHAACYNSILAGATEEMTILDFNAKFQGCQSGGFGSPAMPHHSCVTGVVSTLSEVDASAKLDKDSKIMIRQCDSFLMYGLQGYAGLGHASHGGYFAYGMPGPISHMACYSSTMGALGDDSKPEDLKSKFLACGALAAGNPAAMHHQSCVMQALGSNQAGMDDLKKSLTACDHFMYASFVHGGIAYGNTNVVLPHPFMGVSPHYPIGGVHPAHPLAGVMYGVQPYVHGTHCWCYNNALMSLKDDTKPEEIHSKFGACGAASYQTPHSAAHQVCVMKALGGDAAKNAGSMEEIKKALSTCDALMVISCAQQTHPAAGHILAGHHPATTSIGGVAASPLVSDVHPFAPGVTHGLAIHQFNQVAVSNGYHCYKLVTASFTDKTTKEEASTAISKCATGHAHQACVVSKLAKITDTENIKEPLLTHLATCESFLHQTGPLGQGQPYNGHWQSHQACYQTALTELNDKNIEQLPTRLLACAPLVGGNPGLAAHQTCIQNTLKNHPDASTVGDVKGLLASCDGVLWSGGLYNHGAYEASAHTSCLSTAFSGIGAESKPESVVLAIQSCDHLAGINPTATAYQSCLSSAVKGVTADKANAAVSEITAKCSPVLGHSYLNTGKMASVGSNAVDAAALSGIPVLQAAAAAGVKGQATPLSHQACYSVTISTVTEHTTKDEIARKLNLCGAFAMPGRDSPYGATAVSHQACITAVLANSPDSEMAKDIVKNLKMCDPLMYPGTASQDLLHLDNPKSEGARHMPFVPENSPELPLMYPTHAVAPDSVHPQVVHPALGDVPPILEAMLTGKEPSKDAFLSRYRPGAMHLHHAPLHVHSAVPQTVHHFHASHPSHPHVKPASHMLPAHHLHPAAPVHNHFAPIPPLHSHQLIHFKEKTAGKAASKGLTKAEEAISKSNNIHRNEKIEKKAAKAEDVKSKSNDADTDKRKKGAEDKKHNEDKPKRRLHAKNLGLVGYKEMLETPEQQKADSLFDRILGANKHSGKHKASLRGGRRLLSNSRSNAKQKKSEATPYGYTLSDILNHAGNVLGDKDSSTHFRQGEATSQLPRKKIETIDKIMNPLVEDSGIASQPMALAKKFTTPDKTVILSANRDDGAEPLVPDGAKRVFGGDAISESHLKCLVQCEKDKVEMAKHGMAKAKEDSVARCMKSCFRLASKLYPIAHENDPNRRTYAQGRPDASLMAPRDDASEDAPMPIQGAHIAFTRKSSMGSEKRQLSRSWESAMNYMFDSSPPMTTELSEGEKRTNQ